MMNYLRRKIGSPSPSPSPTASSGKSDENDNGALRHKLDVTEEYNGVFRTKSYLEFSDKVEEQLMRRLSIERRSSISPPSSSPASSSHVFPFKARLAEYVLDPSQETAMNTVQTSAQNNILMDYYNTSLDACNLCEVILRSIHKARSNYKHIQRATNTQHLQKATIAKELASFSSLNNPLSVVSPEKFSETHSQLSDLFIQLSSKQKKIRRKMNRKRFCKKILGYGLVGACGVLAIALLVFAVHSVIGVVGILELLMLCPIGVSWKKKGKGRLKSSSNLHKRVCGQLDLAARGVYILINQLDTIGRLVERLDNEIEHKKAVAGMCVKSYKRTRDVPREGLKELEMSEDGFLEQLDELEKNVYFCVLGINRSRRLVMQETMALACSSLKGYES